MMLKPSLIRTNARYRGPTELEKHINMTHEVLHDLRLLCYKVDSNENDPTSIGQAEAIRDNAVYYITGRQGKTMIHVPTATTLCNTDGESVERFQSISPTVTTDQSIKSRISALESEVRFLLNNL
jgi:hypothetical protein